MARAHLREAVETQLGRIGSTLEAFLMAGLERGEAPTHLASEIHRLTSIEVHWRTVYRWIDDLGLDPERVAAS